MLALLNDRQNVIETTEPQIDPPFKSTAFKNLLDCFVLSSIVLTWIMMICGNVLVC